MAKVNRAGVLSKLTETISELNARRHDIYELEVKEKNLNEALKNEETKIEQIRGEYKFLIGDEVRLQNLINNHTAHLNELKDGIAEKTSILDSLIEAIERQIRANKIRMTDELVEIKREIGKESLRREQVQQELFTVLDERIALLGVVDAYKRQAEELRREVIQSNKILADNEGKTNELHKILEVREGGINQKELELNVKRDRLNKFAQEDLKLNLNIK